MKRKLAVLIPAYNEEKVLPNTLACLVKQVHFSDIYVISDQSTDATEEIARSFNVNVLRNKVRSGKTLGIENGLKHFKIFARYEYVMILDADTYPCDNFFNYIFEKFKKNKNVACVCGQVLTQDEANIFVYYRSLAYFVWQNLFKNILSHFNAISIAPGTATVYKTSVLMKIRLDPKIFIEDFDMTYQVHRKKLGRILYAYEAKVVTQDPDNLRDYIKQLTRWQIGQYQTMRKHKVPSRLESLDISVVTLILVDILHIFLILIIIPAVIAYYKFFRVINLSDPLFLSIFLDMWIFIGMGIMHFLTTRSFAILLLSPFLWLLQYLNIYTTIKALYLTFFAEVYGTWTSPSRRIMRA
ncbi:MAG: glycosyltransferase family 2 protein [Patescibacteria group bacterium]|nr:glycosyltransferase family 2 protein [Patescibacteria group bacterium]